MYGAGTDCLLSVIEEVDPATLHVALVCHNPGVSDLASWLCHDFSAGMPTCGVVTLEIDAESWSGLPSRCGRLVDFDHPG